MPAPASWAAKRAPWLGTLVVSAGQRLSTMSDCLISMQIDDFSLGDSLSTALNLNVTVGAASAPLVAAPEINSTVVTVRSAESIADIVKYNITACMVRPPSYSSFHCRYTYMPQKHCTYHDSNNIALMKKLCCGGYVVLMSYRPDAGNGEYKRPNAHA